MWRISPTGMFSTRSARELIYDRIGAVTHKLWGRIWKFKGPSRASLTLWPGLHRALPTAVFLWRRHIIDSSLCDYCGKENQSDVHILRGCKDIDVEGYPSTGLLGYILCPK